MSAASIRVDRRQVLAFRRTTNKLDARLAAGKRSLRSAAWAGLQDSMPRAAVLSVNARVDSTHSAVWSDPAYVQVWGPRYSVFTVPAGDRALFTLGRLPDDPRGRQRAYGTAARIDDMLDGRSLLVGDVGRGLGVSHNSLRYATTTGTVLIRWDGARQPTIWTVGAPKMDPAQARLDLARRYLHVYGPATSDSFSAWAGIRKDAAAGTFDRLRRSITSVETPIGEASILNRDLDTLLTADPAPSTRLLPSGDAYYLLQGRERELLVPDRGLRSRLWTSRVWPGAVLADGNVVGTWRRTKNRVTINPWRRLSRRLRDEVEAEAEALPLPESDGTIRIEFEQ